MGGRRPCLLALVLTLTILCASFPQGRARNIKIMRLDGGALGKAFAEAAAAAKGRGMVEVAFSTMDYNEPGANTNPWSGYPWANPPPDPQH